MSDNLFSLTKDIISDGDTIFKSPEDVTSLKVESIGILQNRLGRFKHSDIIGKNFGSQVWSSDGKKYLQVLRPTPELWTRALPHRTQILYLPDISFIIEMLDIGRNSVVIESGTGSASFSHSLSRAIGTEGDGKLYTFDFHGARATMAQKEFQDHGLSKIVECSCRDVCNDGFGLENVADAVFLDLPSPWMAISHAKTSLRKDRATRIACFSPCMEQVQRTLMELSQQGFCELEMFEVLQRPLNVEEIEVFPCKVDKLGQKRSVSEKRLVSKHRSDIKGHTSYLYFATLLPSPQHL